MSQIISTIAKPERESLRVKLKDYVGYIKPFYRKIDTWYYAPAFLILKTIEYSIYKYYEPENESWKNYKYELIYQITSKCTDKCPKCGIWKNIETSHIPIEKIIQSIDELHLNLRKITITGGEPLLYVEDIERIAQKSSDLGIPLTVVTNGYLLTPNFLKKMRALKSNLIISIDTIDQEKWILFRGRNHYKNVIKNILLAKSIMGKYLSIQSVIAEESKNDIPLITAFCEKHGIEHNIQDYQDFGGVWHPIRNTEDSELSQYSCSAWLNICILPNGDVVKCFDYKRIPEGKEPLGNISRNNVVDLLSSERSKHLVEVMKKCNQSCKMLRCNQK